LDCCESLGEQLKHSSNFTKCNVLCHAAVNFPKYIPCDVSPNRFFPLGLLKTHRKTAAVGQPQHPSDGGVWACEGRKIGCGFHLAAARQLLRKRLA
jgi:hypothetical protein